MIFSIQRFLEDYFQRRGLEDVDQYAIRLANAFDRLPPGATSDAVAKEIGRIRTAFFRRNRDLDRRTFESDLAAVLCGRFKKKRLTLRSTTSSEVSRARRGGFATTGDQFVRYSANSSTRSNRAASMPSGNHELKVGSGRDPKVSRRLCLPYSQRVPLANGESCCASSRRVRDLST
jgi:hypothetical protein